MRRRLTPVGVLAVLGIVAVLLIFPRLGDRFLWEDEAETALLAKNVLRFGIPVAYDGRDLISQECGSDYDENYLWRQTPWLPIYLTAASFRLLGADPWSARLPSALLALLSLPSLYALARLVFGDRSTALLSVGGLLFSVPFLLYVRQCRYYSLAILAAIWILYFFVAILRDRRGAVIGLAAAATVLFHANYLVFFGMVAGLALGFFVVCFDRAALGRLAGAGAATLLINAPWFFVFDVGGKAGLALGFASPAAFLERLTGYLRGIELQMFPALLLVPTFGLWLAWRRRHGREGPPGLRTALFLVVLAGGQVAALAATSFVFYRYVVDLLPVFALLLAYVVRALATTSPTLAGVVLVAVLLVDRPDALKLVPGSPLLRYAGEITHEVDGPIKGLARYLASEAKPGDRVFITYGALGLRFHTADLEIRGGTGCRALPPWPLPDWIVVRYFFRLNPISPGGREDATRTVEYLNARLATKRYRHLELATIDTVHDNIPEPDIHVFRTPATGRRLTVFRLTDAGASPPLR